MTKFEKLLSYPVVVALSGNPPSNGVDVVQFCHDALNSLGCPELAFAEFNVPCPAAQPTAVLQLLEKRKEEAAKVKKEAEELKVLEKADASAGPALPASVSSSSSYAPTTHASHLSSIFSLDKAGGHYYTDPITESPEDVTKSRLRITVQRLFEAVLVNHLHIVSACRVGDVADLLARTKALCLGDATVTLMDYLGEMVEMSKAPPKTWPELAILLNKLRVHLDLPLDHPMHIGAGVLPAHALRALTHYPELKVELSLLHKIRGGRITVQRIVTDINAAVENMTSPPASSSVRALFSRTPAGSTAPKPTVCFHFRDHGRCKFGDKCHFSHGPVAPASKPAFQTTGACYECNSTTHGIQDCALAKSRKGASKLHAKMAILEKELLLLRPAAQPAAPGGPPAVAPIVGSVAAVALDPFSVWGQDSDLAAVFLPGSSF
jgi:hypothetical protein